MLACEALLSPMSSLASRVMCSWQVKNSGLMIYTIIVKKILVSNVNEEYNNSNMNVQSFFGKYTHLREWFSRKLADLSSDSRFR